MVTNIINHKDNLSSTLKLKIGLLGIEDNLEEGFNNFLDENIDLTDVNAIKNSFIKLFNNSNNIDETYKNELIESLNDIRKGLLHLLLN